MQRTILTLMIALWGAATMAALTGAPGPEASLILPAGLGAGLAGALTAPLFARPHPLWAYVTPVLTTTLGAALAGAHAGFPHDIPLGLVFGPALVWASMAHSPAVLIVWLVGAVALRLTAYSLK